MTAQTLFLGLVVSILAASGSPGADPRLDGYKTPPGWNLSIAATEPLVINPVTMTFGNDGRLYVVEWQPGRGPNDRIKVLTDTNGDGEFDEASIYMDNLELPAGLLFWDGWTYLSLDHDLVRFKDEDDDGKFEKREVLLTGFGNDDSHHRLSGITQGPDGWLYLTTGDSDAHARGSDGSTATVLRCGGVFRCRPDGSKLEVVAMGMRNPWGNVAFDDQFNLFHTDNDNEGSPGFTGCRLLHVVEGGDYGWRLREGARCCQPDLDRATWNGGRPGRIGSITETGRGAPAGLAIVNSAAMPASAHNLLVYPDVFRKLVRAYNLKPTGSTFAVAREFDLLASDDPLFRPDDAEVGPDGALYILDWRTDSGGAGQLSGNGKTGRIYRMTWAGTALEPARPTLPRDRFAKLDVREIEDLKKDLGSTDAQVRSMAGLELIRRHPTSLDVSFRGKETMTMSVADRRQSIATSFGIVTDPRPFAHDVRAGEHKTDVTNMDTALTYMNPADPDRWSVVRLVLGFRSRLQPADAATESRATMEHWPREAIDARAVALALGRYRELRRSKPDESTDSVKFAGSMTEGLQNLLGNGKDLGNLVELSKQHFDRFANLMTADLVAARLLFLAQMNAGSDPVTRDAFTRSLERLGPAGLESVVKAVRSKDESRQVAALYALQGWRTLEGLPAVLAEATTPEARADDVRSNLFRSLREFGPAVAPEPIAAWLASDPQVGSAPKAEALKVLAAMGPRAARAMTAIVIPLMSDSDRTIRKAALSLAGGIRTPETRTALTAYLANTRNRDDDRRLAVLALRNFEDKTLAPAFAAVVKSSTDLGLCGESLKALAATDFTTATELAVGLLSGPSRELRFEAIAVLGQKPESALKLVTLFNAGKLPREDLSRVIEAARPHKSPELSAALAVLMKDRMVGGSEDVGKLRDFVKKQGDPVRGRAVYLDAAKGNCASCHRMEGAGGQVGPDLTRVWDTLSFEKRVESILVPSKEIKEGYATFKVATKDGRTLTGLLLSDLAQGITLRDAQARELTIPSAEVEEKSFEKTSLMPEGVVSHLSLAEFADLLAFLGDKSAQESMRVGAKP